MHVVLFKPLATLAREERDALIRAFERAIAEIPSVRRAQIGRRITHGRGYEQLMTVDYSFAAFIEFDDAEGLRAYLRHPAHEQLGERFFAAFEAALMYDYDVSEGSAGLARRAER